MRWEITESQPPGETRRGDKGAPARSRDHRGEIRQRSAAVTFLRSHIKDEHAPHAARVSASQAILDRAYGKAPTLNTSDPTVMKRAIDMTDDELAAIASGASFMWSSSPA